MPLLTAPLYGAPKARIKDIEIFQVPVNKRGGWLLVRLHTDAGVSGIGDASHGYDEPRTIAHLKQFTEALKGRAFSDVEYLRKIALPLIKPRDHSVATAFSGIEQALWDIAGQVYGVPVHALFGGKLRGEIRNYANINRATTDRSPSDFAKLAANAVKDGFTAIKLASFDGFPKDSSKVEDHIRKGIECIAAMREAIGPKADLLVDAHSNFTVARGLQLARELEPYNLFWLEEVVRGIPGLAEINRGAKMQTAGGEDLFGVQEFYPYAAGGAADILMPDIKYCGGLLELKKIAALGEGAGLPVSPHGPASPIGNLAAAHVCATIPNFLILECAYGETPWRAEILDPPEQIQGGILTLTDRPGFGAKLNGKRIKSSAVA